MSQAYMKRSPEKSTTAHDVVSDIEFGVSAALPLIASETATVGFIRAEKKTMWREEKLILWFAICDPGDCLGQELFMACVIPKNNQSTSGSKLLRNWIIATGKRHDRYDRMTTRVFKDKYFVAKLKTVTMNKKHGQLPPQAHYTIIETLLSQA